MRVHVVDPSAYTPPYDHALCRALGDAGAQVELFTSHFAHGPVETPEGYARHEFFYRGARRVRGAAARRVVKLIEHAPDMARYARASRGAEVVHFQWLSVQLLDGLLLPRGGRPLVLTAHDILPREPSPGQRAGQRRLYERFDAIVVHSDSGRRRLQAELGVDGARVHVIPHGAFAHLAHGDATPPPFQTSAPVVLFFGLMRPYKGIEVLLEAWRGIPDAELWIAGMPRMDLSPLRAVAPPGVRFDPRFIAGPELRGYFRRADVVVLPYLEAEQSGVLFTALAFGKPMLLSDVGGFPEVAATGAARMFPAGDGAALHDRLIELLGDPAAREAIGERARAAARDTYAWGQIGARTLRLYESLLGDNPSP